MRSPRSVHHHFRPWVTVDPHIPLRLFGHASRSEATQAQRTSKVAACFDAVSICVEAMGVAQLRHGILFALEEGSDASDCCG